MSADVRHVGPQQLLGNPTSNPALVSEIMLGTGLSFSGSTLNSSGGGGSGTVTTASVVSANGFAGSVATATTTPAITISTSITGLLKGNGTAISAAGAADLPMTGLEIDSHFGLITADTQSTGTWTVNLASSDWHTITLTASITTLTLSNGTVGQQFTLIIIQGGTGSYTVAWPANTKWPGGVAPTLTTTVGGIDVITIKIVSSGHYYAFVAGAALA